MRKTIAITGANGFLGLTLVNYFAGKGWHVVGLVRDPGAQTAKEHVEYRAYDISKPLATDTLKGVDFLVHTAYVTYSRSQPNAVEVNLQGAKNLLAESRKQNVARNIFISSMSAHDSAESMYGKQKLAIEKLFNKKTDISLRCGLIIGNGGIVKQMVDFMRTKHVVPLMGGGKQPLQSVAVSDVCVVVERCTEKAVNGVMTIAHPDVFSYKTFYATIAEVFSIKIVFVPVPLWTLMTAATIIELVRLPLGFGRDNVLGLKQLRSADSAKDLATLGVTLMPLKAALIHSGIH